MHLFEVLDKPRFSQNDELVYQPTWDELESDVFGSFALAEDEGYFYTIAQESQVLYKLNIKTLEYEMVASLPGEKKIWGYNAMICYNNKLFIAANNSNASLLIFDVATKLFSKIYFNEERVLGKFAYIAEHNGDIYLLPFEYSSIVKYNPINNSVQYITLPKKNEQTGKTYDKHKRFSGNGTVLDNSVYIPCLDDCIILKFCLLDESISFIELRESTYGFISVNSTDNTLWITSYREPKIYRYDLRSKCIADTYIFENEEYHYLGAPLELVCISEDKGVVIPHAEKKSYYVDINSGEITIADELISNMDKSYKSSYYQRADNMGVGGIRVSGDSLLAVNLYEKSIEKYNLKDKIYDHKPIECELRQESDASKYIYGIKVISESIHFSLSKFLFWVDKDYAINKYHNYLELNEDTHSGRLILEHALSLSLVTDKEQ